MMVARTRMRWRTRWVYDVIRGLGTLELDGFLKLAMMDCEMLICVSCN